jgi:hypothetical protein
LAHLFIAKENPISPPPVQKEDPNKYRQEHGKCPKGYHVDEDTGKCITNQELMEKLQKRMQEEQKTEEAKPEARSKQDDYEKGVPSIRKRDSGDAEFDEVLDQVKSSYGLMKHIPKGLRKAVKYPFKFLADRFQAGNMKWSGEIAKEEAAIKQQHADNPFLRGEKMSPEEEDKAAKAMFSGAGKRWCKAIASVGGSAFKWAAHPKQAIKDVGSAFVKTMTFMGRRTGDVAEILGGIVGKHKAVGTTLSKIASGRFHEVTKKEKQACWEVGLEAVEIVALSHFIHGHAAKHASSAHTAIAEHASEAAGSMSEEGMSEALVEHMKTASPESLHIQAKMAAAGEFLGGALHQYIKKMETGGTIKLIDEIAHGIVNGEHHHEGGKKHAGFKFASDDDELKAASSYFGKKVLEHFLEYAKSYKPTPKVALNAMRVVGSMASISHLAKMEANSVDNGGKSDVDSDLSQGILDKMEKTSARVTPGKKNFYDYGLMKSIASRFLKAVHKAAGKFYEHTWMNSPPHHEKEHLRNFGDVVVELRPGYENSPEWSSVEKAIEDLIASFEKDYPGIAFAITSKGKGRDVIATHAHLYHYPEDEGTHYVYSVDSIRSWW